MMQLHVLRLFLRDHVDERRIVHAVRGKHRVVLHVHSVEEENCVQRLKVVQTLFLNASPCSYQAFLLQVLNRQVVIQFQNSSRFLVLDDEFEMCVQVRLSDRDRRVLAFQKIQKTLGGRNGSIAISDHGVLRCG